MAWRLSYMPCEDRHPEIEVERLRLIFSQHPESGDELAELLRKAGLL